jgi:hypothetical protein
MVELDIEAAIELHRVETPEEAVELRFRGSPTLLIDGTDPFVEEDAPFGLSCRVYLTEAGVSGEPTYDQLRNALARNG